jgi:putative ABC transport system permease protein
LIFSLIPALRASRADLNQMLKDSAGWASGGVRGSRGRNLLVVSQLALSCALMIVAGLILRTIHEVLEIDWGFDSSNVLTFAFDLPQGNYPEDQQIRAFFDRILPELRSLPGISGAAVVSPLPIFARERTAKIALEGGTVQTPQDQPWAVVVHASPGYFDTLKMPLLQGRDFSNQDAPESAPAALVSREFARRYWSEADPIGKRLAIQAQGGRQGPEWIEVVGLTGDLRSPDITDAPKPTVFLSMAHSPRREASVVLKGSGDPTPLAAAVRRVIRRVDPDLAIYEVKTLALIDREENNSRDILSAMFTGFAAIALLMAAAGLYAVISYSVSQRAHEIGIRMALGAGTAQIRALVMRQGLRLILVSIAVGLLAGAGLGRAMASLLYGISTTDPITFVAVTLILVSVALLGTYLPTRHAVRVDPVRTLRSD